MQLCGEEVRHAHQVSSTAELSVMSLDLGGVSKSLRKVGGEITSMTNDNDDWCSMPRLPTPTKHAIPCYSHIVDRTLQTLLES